MISSKSSQIHLLIICVITQRVRSCLQYRCCCKLGNAWACSRNSMCSKTAWAWCILVFCRAGWKKTDIHERCQAIMLFIQRPRGVKTIKSGCNKHFENFQMNSRIQVRHYRKIPGFALDESPQSYTEIHPPFPTWPLHPRQWTLVAGIAIFFCSYAFDLC